MAAGRNRINPIRRSVTSLKDVVSRLDKRTSSLSNISLSLSGLNEAIINVMNADTKIQQCRKICVGNPITVAGKRKQMAKMLAQVLIPLLILITITALDFKKSYTSYLDTAEIVRTLDFTVELGNFLMVLQKERDMSSLYLSKIGSDTKVDLLHAYIDTDTALDNIRNWPDVNDIDTFKTREGYINHLNRHRYQLDTTNTSVTNEMDFYSNDIDIFLKWMYSAIKEVETGTIWKTLVGYQELIIASEYIGRERGYGIYFYAVGSFRNVRHYLRFVESQDTAMTFFESARLYSVTAADIYEQTLATQNFTLSEIRKMRSEIKRNNSSIIQGSLAMAKYWYSNMSLYRDVMRYTQNMLTDKINRLLEKNSTSNLTDMAISGAISVGILLISPIIVFSVYKLTSNIQKYSINIAKKTKAVNKEKKQSETILFQMLPKAIAETLKHNEAVQAEMFDDSTIFQSDMVGFTKLSSNSSPLMVTTMLNNLFSLFDNRIGLYDVYKVETIGDGYLVVSGVPRRIGNKHATEIATMALDILYHVSRLELPQFPGEKYKLRIGCHSGNVVAGVVGSKNPRYCLFGSTVRVAALMESSGETNKIQISHSTWSHLQSIEGFEMEERMDVPLNVTDILKTHGCEERTYWLLRRKSSEWQEDDSMVSSSMSFGSTCLRI